MADANTTIARVHTRKQKAEPKLEFRWALAQRMLLNNLDSDGKSVKQVEWPHTCNATKKLSKENILDKRLFYKEWDDEEGTWKRAKDHYQMPFLKFGAKRGANHFVIVIKRCQWAWNVTIMLLI